MSKCNTDNESESPTAKPEQSLQKSKSCPDVSMKEFFDFFQTAYQLHKMVEGCNDEPTQTHKLFEIDWNNLVQSNLTQKQESDERGNQTSAADVCSSAPRRKLNQVLQEGLLDSVLPYLVPKHCSSASSASSAKHAALESKLRLNVQSAFQPERTPTARRKHVASSRSHKAPKTDVEVEIHVCDELKGLKRTFRCPQRLLVTEMGYFAEVTAGQRLEDMDISVHCDVANFEWLMQWVKRDQQVKETWPKLDCANVVAVMTSAAFLQMDLLLDTCLQFCYTRANDVLAGPANLLCLNDSVLTRLAGMFSNAEVERLHDRKDRLQGRLYCKLISALADLTAEEHRGHFATLARLFRCSECNTLIASRSLAPRVPCTPSNTCLGRTGDLQHVHVRSSSWSLTEHVASLKAELQTWRRVYWRLWGQAHWLVCLQCHAAFALAEAAWCRQHAEPPQFVRACGRHACCGRRLFRFSPLSSRQGCQYGNHTPELTSEKEQSIWSIFQEHKNLIMVAPPTTTSSPDRHKVTSQEASGDEECCLPCLRLEPAPFSLGLLSTAAWEPSAVRRAEGVRHVMQSRAAPSELSSSSSGGGSGSSSASSDEDGPEDEEECLQACQLVRVTARPLVAAAPVPPRTLVGRHWDPSLTTRCNQDDQREYEEKAVRRLVSWLSRRPSAVRSQLLCMPPMGGTFVALEREWRDAHLRTDKPVSSSRHRAKSSRS